MAGNLFLKYGSANQSITIALNSLASFTYRQSTYVVNNGATPYFDVHVQMKIIETSNVRAIRFVDVYAYGSSYGTSNFTDECTGSDAAFDGNLFNLFWLGRISFTDASQTKIGGPWSLRLAFGGVPPQHWGIVVDNETGSAFASAGCLAWYQGLFAQYS